MVMTYTSQSSITVVMFDCRNLRSLSLHELPEVKNKKEAFDMLVQELPNCSVHYHDENFEMSCEGK